METDALGLAVVEDQTGIFLRDHLAETQRLTALNTSRSSSVEAIGVGHAQ